MIPDSRNAAARVRRRIPGARAVFLTGVLALFVHAGPVSAGAPPDRLDDNLVLTPVTGLVTATVSGVLSPVLVGFGFAPLSPINLSGRVLTNPKIYNVYWDSDWETDNPTAPTRAQLDLQTSNIVDSTFFGPAFQYGVGPAIFAGEHGPSALCGTMTPGASVDLTDLIVWISCMAGLANGIPGLDAVPLVPGLPTVSGLPSPDPDSLYVIYLPTATTSITGYPGGKVACTDYNAFHAFSIAPHGLLVPSPFPTFSFDVFPFAVVLTGCPGQTAEDTITAAASHEMIEAATDTVPGLGFIDDSLINLSSLGTLAGSIANPFSQGEAGDICSGIGAAPSPFVRLNGAMVAPYWSNADGACVPHAPHVHLAATGLPGGVAGLATFDGSPVALPFDTNVTNGTHSYSFVTPIADPVNPGGVRYVTSQPPASVSLTADLSVTAAYSTEFLLDVGVSPDLDITPATLLPLDASLTAGGWYPASAVIPLATDAFISIDPLTRYRFNGWSGGCAGATSSLLLAGPLVGASACLADYVEQSLHTYDETGLPPGTAWTVTVGGTLHSGPYSEWQDVAGAAPAFTYEDPVQIDATTRFRLVSLTSNTRALTSMLYGREVLHTYDQSGIPAGVPWTVTVGGTTESGPFQQWEAAGAPLPTVLYQDPVPDPGTAGKRYRASGLVASPMLTVESYGTQDLLTVLTSGLGSNLTHVANGAVALGTASDAVPLEAWMDQETPLALAADSDVSTPDGVQRFFQAFTPPPPATLPGPLSVTAVYLTMSQLIDGALASGTLGGPGASGLANSYRMQFAAAQADLGAMNYGQALSDLQSFISHVKAQAGHRLATATAQSLELDALLVYHGALCSAFAAGQVGAATASADYDYYAALVAALGGTPLPPC